MKLKEIYQNVVEGKAEATVAGVKAALEAGVAPEEILSKGLIAAHGSKNRRENP